MFVFEVNAGTAHDLVNDHPLGAIDDERATLGHQRQLADEHLLLFDLAGFLVDQPAGDIHLGSKGRIATLCLFHIVAGTLEPVLAADEMQLQLAGVIGDRRKAVKLLDQALFKEPFEAGPLHLHQIGQVGDGLGDLDRAAHAGELRDGGRNGPEGGRTRCQPRGSMEPTAEGTPVTGDGERRNDHKTSPGEGGGKSGRAPMELAGVRARGS